MAINSDQHWRFAACGKHPVTGDYFTLGREFPLLKGFSTWVEKGYQLIVSKRASSLNIFSWRFWARSSDREGLACGLLRDSGDSLGRPYPILIMGTGPLNGWEKEWNLLPLACEKTWSQMESISTRTFPDVRHLEDEIQRIKPPQPHWSELIEMLKELWKAEADSEEAETSSGDKEGGMISREKEEIFVSLDESPFKDYLIAVHQWHSRLKTGHAVIPKTVFMGGNPLKPGIAFFKRPLVPQDFSRLWSIRSED